MLLIFFFHDTHQNYIRTYLIHIDNHKWTKRLKFQINDEIVPVETAEKELRNPLYNPTMSFQV